MPKTGTKEEALEAKLAAEIRYADEVDKAATWKLRVEDWEKKGDTAKTVEDDLAKIVSAKKSQMEK